MTIQEYLENINRRFKTGISSEHTYRSDLQVLLQGMFPGFLVTNEPARIECGAPDYVITKKDVPIGYIEAKDIGVDLSGKALMEQFDRYRSSLENLVFTDYLEFRRYKDGEFVASTRIAEIKKEPLFLYHKTLMPLVTWSKIFTPMKARPLEALKS
jgi:hypothetical protein